MANTTTLRNPTNKHIQFFKYKWLYTPPLVQHTLVGTVTKEYVMDVGSELCTAEFCTDTSTKHKQVYTQLKSNSHLYSLA